MDKATDNSLDTTGQDLQKGIVAQLFHKAATAEETQQGG
jgi:hypothetical protein